MVGPPSPNAPARRPDGPEPVPRCQSAAQRDRRHVPHHPRQGERAHRSRRSAGRGHAYRAAQSRSSRTVRHTGSASPDRTWGASQTALTPSPRCEIGSRRRAAPWRTFGYRSGSSPAPVLGGHRRTGAAQCTGLRAYGTVRTTGPRRATRSELAAMKQVPLLEEGGVPFDSEWDIERPTVEPCQHI